MTLNFTALWDALGWSILHSLWQGAIIALVVLTLRAAVTERRAKLRYLIGMVGMVATFAAFLITYVILTAAKLRSWSPSQISSDEAVSSGGLTDLTISVSVLPVQTFDGGVAVALVPWLGMAWAIGFAFLSLQAYRAWATTRWLATSGLRTTGPDWNHRFSALVRRSRTHERVRLYISEHVTSPLTLGALRPIVLVPIGFLTSLPSAQVEAILLHELAHIRRHDFLFGLIQTAIKTVLYFNPTVLMMSRLIDVDREQACDDIAVQITGRPADLARGLAALRLGSHAPALTMAADGGPLLTRLNRLMGQPTVKSSSNRLSAAAVSALMLGTAACSTVSMAQSQTVDVAQEETTYDAKSSSEVLPDTVVRPDRKVSVEINGVEVRAADLPPMPVMPPMPVVPVVPPVPPTPVVPNVPDIPPPNFDDYDGVDDFETAMEAWGEKMDAWGETMEVRFEGEWEEKMDAWGEAVEARFEGEWEEKMEAWGEEMEAWGEKMEVWGESLEAAGVDFDNLDNLENLASLEALKSLESLGNLDVMVNSQLRVAHQKVQQREREIENLQDRAEREVEEKVRARERAQRQKEQAIRVRENSQRKAELAIRNKERKQRKLEEKRRAQESHSNSHSKSTHTISVEGLEAGKSIHINGRKMDVAEFRQSLLSELVRDSLVNRSATAAVVEVCGDTMNVDGKKTHEAHRRKYAKFLNDAGFYLEESVKVKIKDDGASIILQGDKNESHTKMSLKSPDHASKK